jgi:hypothetical protein
MARFRTKPNIIEAYRVSERTIIPPGETVDRNIHVVYPGDYLCIDNDGFKFPCRSEVFEKIYEPAVE